MSGHRPYYLSRSLEPPEHEGIVGSEIITKLDLLTGKQIQVLKVVCEGPSVVHEMEDSQWEANLKYSHSCLYDLGLVCGTYYTVENNRLVPVRFETPPDVEKALQKAIGSASPTMKTAIEEWAALLNQPLPRFKRCALDIEVASVDNTMPNPDMAIHPIIGVSLVSENVKIAYILRSKNMGVSKFKPDVVVKIFDMEIQLLRALFIDLQEWPFVLTFNGDDFDLPYLSKRAVEIGIGQDEIPIVLGKQHSALRNGIHIDLYKTFSNKSLQVYAFNNKYSGKTLNDISEALLDKSKIEFDGLVGDLPAFDMANYNLHDSELTYELTSMSGDLLMKLLVILARVSKMPIDDLSRVGASGWIKSMTFYEHRRQNALIPRPEELFTKAKSTAIIKGKKYKGGQVIEPVSGVHFMVDALDFSSLYPTTIKRFNLSYETVNCPHEECKKNKIPEVDSYYCSERVGIESLIIGSLRDLRVEYYKHLSKMKALSSEDRELYSVISQTLKVNLNACFAPDTDLITPDGIKNIKNMKIGDKVINVNPETMQTEIDEVVETQEFDYNGEMIHFQNQEKIDVIVTPNHKMLVKTVNGFNFIEAKEVKKSTLLIPEHEDTLQYNGNCISANCSIELYKGDVYCVTTKKNHTVFAGRNNTFCILGQSYGVLGFEEFPLYSLAVAEAVTALGRFAINSAIEQATLLKIPIILSDTDSMYLEKPKPEQIKMIQDWTSKNLGLDIEVDKKYRYIVTSNRKKNYFGVLEDGTVDIKGLSGKKSATPAFIKDAFYQILYLLTKIYTNADFEIARDEIMAILKNLIKRLKDGQIPLDSLSFNMMINKEMGSYVDKMPQHVKAAQMMQFEGIQMKQGDIVEFVKCSNGAIPVKMADVGDIDIDKYLEYIEKTFDQLLGSLGYSVADVQAEMEGATKLDAFYT